MAWPKTTDVARFELQKSSYESAEAYRRALLGGNIARERAGNMMIPKALFSDPFLIVAM